MAFHRIGDSIYSDDELRHRNEEVISLLVPAVVTAIGVYFLHATLSVLPFFVVHTTMAKLAYIFTGLVLFCLGYAFRKLIVVLVFLAVAGTIFTLCGIALWHWLIH
ncbi:hypothetical protein [Massilia scottii]|uniref:hypothetical protein n=1 Tax=Massilia scottii TaxID=3057166 RepID=UPI0027964712|nr:hypothetical protein [Massilia sp. CCM 9029]MDQ1832769.1 hypothetical protein [Massilia sp. CCM 9029]